MEIARKQPEEVDVKADLNRLCIAFRLAWVQNQSPQIVEYLSCVPSFEDRLTLFRELLAMDIEFRHARGEQVSLDSYRNEFPDLVAAVDTMNKQSVPATIDSAEGLYSTQDPTRDSRTERPADAVLGKVDYAPLNLSDYDLDSLLGSGGQGDVYLATQRSLGRRVAVKLLRHGHTESKHLEHRFIREAKTLAQSSHPQIVTIHGIGRTPKDELFLVMEYIAGEDLAKQISHKQLSIIEAVEIILKVASAVEHAHSKGIIHRDLKPSNVLWHEFRGPVVTDFGLAKDLRKSDYFSIPDQLLGTPSFMAPEQADRRFGEIAEQTDVYGLGATFYALLTGQPPIVGRSLVEVLNQLTSDTPIPSPQTLRLEIDNNLSAICMKSLAKQPMQRYPTIATFSADLQRWLKGEQRESQDPNATPRFDTPNMQNTDLAPGCRFGRFQMIELISGNTEWKVFRAADDLGNPILLKCLPQELLQDANARSRFRQEVLFASQVSHPCLAKVVEAGTLQQIEYVALEFVVGQNLAERISEQGPLDEALAIDILTRIAEALHLLHHAGILFRDLRPQNICLDHRKQPRLVEHRLSRENLDACTLKPEKNGVDLEALSYQAPEFWLNQTETVANDIYMLGATLFTLLTGEPPFASDLDHIRLMLAKNAGHFKSVKSFAQGSSDAIDELIKSCLQPDPAKRPSTAHEFAERLTACAVSEMRGFIGAYNTGPKVSQILADDNVQFSVFRPKSIPPDVWQPLLAFAHLAELPQDASPEMKDPITEVQRQAKQVLGDKLPMYTSLTADSAQSIPQSSELTFVPSGEGLVFNPPQRSFLWQEPVHREEFRFKAAVGLDGKVSRGRLSVYLGRLLIAEVHLVIRVDSMPKKKHLTLVSEDHAQRFRRIYASVSRKDLEIIAEFKRYSELLNDRFLTTQFDEHPASRDTQSLIRSADVFQLYWSNNALLSQELEQEWTYALSLNRPGFVCPLYWEEPFPTDSARSMPPPELLKLGFQKIPQSKKQQSSIAESMKMSDPTSKADNLGVIFLDSRNDSDDVSTVTFDVTYDRDAPKPGESCSDLGGDNSDGGNDTMILCNDSDDSSTVAFFDSIDLCDTQSPDSVEFSIEFELCVRKQEQEEESRTDCGVASSDEVDEYCSEPGSITLSIPKSEDVISIHKEQKKHTGEKGWFETPTLRSRQSNLKWAMLAILAILTAMLLIRILWYFM